MYLIISGVGVLVSDVYYAAQYFGDFIIVGWVTIAAFLLSISCLGVFLKSAFELITGHRRGSVGDH
jgi:hypothetical protein